MKNSFLHFVDRGERRLQNLAESAERNLLQVVQLTEQRVERVAKRCVPLINIFERLVLRGGKKPSLRASSIAHFNQQATCFSRN